MDMICQGRWQCIECFLSPGLSSLDIKDCALCLVSEASNVVSGCRGARTHQTLPHARAVLSPRGIKMSKSDLKGRLTSTWVRLLHTARAIGMPISNATYTTLVGEPCSRPSKAVQTAQNPKISLDCLGLGVGLMTRILPGILWSLLIKRAARSIQAPRRRRGHRLYVLPNPTRCQADATLRHTLTPECALAPS